jgi:hydrogenase maturation protease
MNLLPTIEEVERVLFLDAIDAGRPAGTLLVLEREDLPRSFALKLSPHQIDLREVLALAELRGTLPSDLVAIGIQPGRIEMSFGLSSEVELRMDDLLRAAVERLGRWGYACNPLEPAVKRMSSVSRSRPAEC